MSAKAVLTQAAKALGEDLNASGYKRSGLKLVRHGGEVLSFIELQISRSSSASALTFVVNYGIVVTSLSPEVDRPTYTDCHWGGRV